MHTWNELDSLLDSVGGAAYIVRMDNYRANVERFCAAFRAHYPNTNLGYSYKTNYLPAMCVEAHRLGLYAEVVSGMEYEVARACGVPDERIIFNGPAKTPTELTAAFAGGALVNIDGLDEAQTVAEVLAEHPHLNVRLGLRCNMELQCRGKTSRFGLSGENGDLHRAAKMIEDMPNATLVGLHCHYSYDRSVESYQRRARMLIRLADELFGETTPEFLDVGGGFCGPMPPALLEQLKFTPPTYEDYAEAIGPIFAERYGTDGGPELICEPGVGVVADTLDFACRIEAVKTLPGRTVAVTAGSVDQLKIVHNDVNLPLEVYRPDGAADEPGEPIDLVGFTCLEHDVLYLGYTRSLRKGDVAVFSNVGGYSFVTSAPFIRTTPPVVARTEDGGWRTLMNKLSVDELMSRFTW